MDSLACFFITSWEFCFTFQRVAQNHGLSFGGACSCIASFVVRSDTDSRRTSRLHLFLSIQLCRALLFPAAVGSSLIPFLFPKIPGIVQSLRLEKVHDSFYPGIPGLCMLFPVLKPMNPRQDILTVRLSGKWSGLSNRKRISPTNCMLRKAANTIFNGNLP